MNEAINAEERAYWVKEVQRRAAELAAARARGEAAHLIAGHQLRLSEADERLRALPPTT